jgi:hypothetical protein
MDDLIYFLLVIGWLAFSFYQQAAKKKKAQMKNTREEYDNSESYPYEVEHEYETQEEERKPQPDFKQLLEEMLMGKEAQAAKPTSEYDQQEDFDRKEKKEVNIYQQYLEEEVADGPFISQEKIESLEERRAALENEMVVAEKDDDDSESIYQDRDIDFDLRKAVIYSEILNRRYAN